MRDINHIVVSGEVIELTPFEGKMAVTRMELNVTDSKDNLTPVKVVTFGEVAEQVERNVKKGDRILVFGNLRQNAYKTKNGKEFKSMEIGGQGVLACKDIEQE
jgi:single-stranded DNA-binding protein